MLLELTFDESMNLIQPILICLIFALTIYLMFSLDKKFPLSPEKWFFMMLTFLFSLIFSSLSIGVYGVPFTPYLQLFYIIFQLSFFIKT